jgi:CelD/BcsL family acetyltransferase involved in cellulose biosynthesis
MDVKLVRPAELTAEQVSIWSQLQRADNAVASPYFRPEFTLAVSRVRDDVEVAVLYEGSEIVGFFPFQRSRFNVGKPVGGRLSDFQGVIVRKDLGWSVDDLMRGCRLTAWDFDHLITSQEAFGAHHWLTDESPYLDLSNGFDAYLAEMHGSKSNHVKNALRKSRKVERELGPLHLEFNTSDDTVFERLKNLKSQQYQSTKLLDIFRIPWIVNLLEQIRAQQTDDFSGVLSALYIDDQLAAAHFGMRTGHVLHYWFPVYDRAFLKYSPGLILLMEMARVGESLGIDRIDLGRGSEQFKRSFMSGAIPVAEGSVECRPVSRAIRQNWRRTCEWMKTSSLRDQVELPLRVTRPMRQWLTFR